MLLEMVLVLAGIVRRVMGVNHDNSGNSLKDGSTGDDGTGGSCGVHTSTKAAAHRPPSIVSRWLTFVCECVRLFFGGKCLRCDCPGESSGYLNDLFLVGPAVSCIFILRIKRPGF